MASVDRIIASALRQIYMEEGWNDIEEPPEPPKLAQLSQLSQLSEDATSTVFSEEEPLQLAAGGAAAPRAVFHKTAVGTTVAGIVVTLGALML